MSVFVLGLGSNLQNGSRTPVDHIREAIRLLRLEPKVTLLGVSPVYESEAMLPPGATTEWNIPYKNAALALETSLSPIALLGIAKEIEKTLGRQDRGRWAPREIDIDLLVGETKFKHETLTLPHPGLWERPFAALPFLDLITLSPLLAPRLASALPPPVIARQWMTCPAEDRPFKTNRVPDPLFPEWVGVLNITPDSFSDGGKFTVHDRFVSQAKALIESGASILDIGAESTRPDATPITPNEEQVRLAALLPSWAELKQAHPHTIFSLDTKTPQTVKWILSAFRDLGVPKALDWVNDVTGFTSSEMIDILLSHRHLQGVVMHELGVPPRRDLVLPKNESPSYLLHQWGQTTLKRLTSHGLKPGQIILDPGIGFGKSSSQTFDLFGEWLRGAPIFDAPVLLGHSRKSFLSPLLTPQISAEQRDLETATLSGILCSRVFDYVRVHEIAPNRRAVRAAFACLKGQLF